MKNRKELDQLYRERLRNVEVKPPVDAWKTIASRLPEKQEKKSVLPLWYKIVGAAAVLLLLVSLSYTYFNPFSVSNENPITSEEKNPEKLQEKENKRPELQLNNNPSQQPSSRVEIAAQETGKELPSQDNRDTSIEDAGKPGANTGKQALRSNQVALEAAEMENEEELVAVNGDSSKASTEQDESQLSSLETVLEEAGLDQIAATELPLNSQNKEDDISENKSGRLSIGPKAAPVFFDLSGVTGIQGAPGTGTGEASISYGVQVAYKLSKNISIRSGLQIVNLNSSTHQIPMEVAVMKEVSGNGATLVLAAPVSEEMELKKNLNFFEVPVELEYALIDSKFKLNLIGGGSFLLRDRSTVSLKSPSGVHSLQQSESLDPLGFTTNIGVGAGIELSRQLELNLEPMVKFPLSSGSSLGSYYFGIYSGIRYRF